VLARPDATRAEEMREAIGPCIELCVAELCVAAHDCNS
jgi:hypothetical protein